MKESDKILPSFFWTSYSDLMTTLFFLMTLLYVISVIYLNKTKSDVEDKLYWVEKVQKSVDMLQYEKDADDNPYFEYDKKSKRFSLTKNITFEVNKAEIRTEDDREYLIGVGNSIKKVINESKNDLKDEYGEVSYLVIIEGFASWDGNTKRACINANSQECKEVKDKNLALSHDRAVSLLAFWKNNNITFDRKFTEFKLIGRGLGGGEGRDKGNEENNQRISISIMPKIDYKEDEN